MDLRTQIAFYAARFAWVANIAGITLIAYFAASIFTNALALKMTAPPRVRAAAQDIAVVQEEKKDLNYYFSINERNIFNSQATALSDTLSSITGPVAQSNLKVKLLGTVEGPPEVAFAIILDEAANQTDILRVGDKVLKVAPVLRIERNRVVILHDGRQEALTIYEEDPNAPVQVAAAQINSAPPIAPSSPGAPPRIAGPDVKMITPNKYEIPKVQFDQQLSNIGPLLTQARVVPNLTDGKISGYRIFSIVPDSLYAKIGLKDGDIIQNVNGSELSTPESALGLFQKLRNENRFQVDIVRDGARQSLTYSIR